MKKQIFGFILGVAVMGLLAMNDFQSQDQDLAKVEKVEGKYLFINSIPVKEYTIVFEFSHTPLGYWGAFPPKTLHKNIIKAAFRKQKGIDFDGVIMKDGTDENLAIKFK